MSESKPNPHQRFYLKFTDLDGRAPFASNSMKYKLPKKDGTPGAWMSVCGKLVPCTRGFHVCTAPQLTEWNIQEGSRRLFVVEVDGPGLVHESSKTVFSRIRFVKEVELPANPQWLRCRQYVELHSNYFRRQLKNVRDAKSKAKRASWAW